ncbi:unnamed protein product [Haemonchus placei]|uniref:Uncharacterized protein n=1 Tax=Haemonchus placei TaxID=6290 RepID=A0A158QLX0_HAEPC|nr:unnamed protein product [Haemonchus placei]
MTQTVDYFPQRSREELHKKRFLLFRERIVRGRSSMKHEPLLFNNSHC